MAYITRKDLSLKIIRAFHTFFNDERGYDMTLFFWSTKVHNNHHINIKFNWRVSENNDFIIGSSAYELITIKNFKSPYAYFNNNYELSEHIDNLISDSEPYQVSENDYNSNFSILSGVVIHHSNWLKDLRNLLGSNYVDEYLALHRYTQLDKKLSIKEGLKQIKI